MSQFHALNKNPEDLRSTAEVFSSVAKDADRIGSRFSSGGKFTEEQFKAGEDATEAPLKGDEVQAEDEAEDAAPGKSSCRSGNVGECRYSSSQIASCDVGACFRFAQSTIRTTGGPCTTV
jgi:hypothetical protein